MLFVRTPLPVTMVKACLLAISLLVVTLAMPPTVSYSSSHALNLILYPEGLTHVSTIIDVDPMEPNFELDLFGPSVDNFVAVDENEFVLSSEITGSKAIIDTFGSSFITVTYDIHDLISKDGRVWTFSMDSSTNYSLLMPPHSIIVEMNTLPTNIVVKNDQTILELGSSISEISYIFGTPDTSVPEPQLFPDEALLVLIGGAVAVSSVIIIKRKQWPRRSSTDKTEVFQEPASNPIDPETIFKLRPEMRDDDQDIVRFISERGGRVLERDLRKKFLQPRTTMWRAVKRLERLGVIETTKKDLQNLVMLKNRLESED